MCVDKRCSGGAISWFDVDGGGWSSSSKSMFSSGVYGGEEGDVVVVGGSSSSKVAFSFDGSGGDGMVLSKLDGGG